MTMSQTFEDVGSLGYGHPTLESMMNTPTIRTGKPTKAAPVASAVEDLEPKTYVATSEATIADIPLPPKNVPAAGMLAPTVKDGLFPVRLLKHYRPMDGVDKENGNTILSPFKVVSLSDPEDEYSQLVTRDPTAIERKKVFAGTIIRIPPDEATRAIKLKIAERADDWNI
jgi:hypothetical protein